MAALETAVSKSPGKKPRARKRSFRPDMTPMVDLAFLLLTFFMLTTTFAKPRVQLLQMPVRDYDHPSDVPESRAMTILLGRGREVAYYFGLNRPGHPAPALHRTDFSARGLRQALLRRQQQGPPIVLIKADQSANYQSLVDVLDEMNITSQEQYALTELSPADRQLLAANGPQ